MRVHNGRFVIPFFAQLILAPICTWFLFADDQVTAGWWGAAATVLAVTTLAITIIGNVPLNNALEAAGRTDDSSARAMFEVPWTRWNDLRTATLFLAFCAAVGTMVATV